MDSIGVAIIAKQAGQSIYDCIKSFEACVDDIVVVLAGKSTDNTAMQARKASNKVRLFNFRWVDDFSAARNFSFSKLNNDFVLWIDSDDVIEGADKLRELVQMSPPNIAGIWFPYYYAFDDMGNCTTLFDRERLLRTSVGWIWRSRVHETVSPLNTPVQYAKSDEIRVIHRHMDAGGSRSDRNFGLLKMMHKEDPEDKRVWMYLGFQHFAGMEWDKAVEWFLKFSECEDVLPIEKWQCLTYAGRALRNAGKYKDGISCDLLALELYPGWADSYIGLCGDYAGMGDWEKSIYWGEQSLTKSPPDRMIFNNPLDLSFNVFQPMATSYINLHEFEKAIAVLQKALQTRPNDEQTQDQLKRITQAKMKKDVYDGVEKLYADLANEGDWVKASRIHQILPEWLRNEPITQQLAQRLGNKIKEDKTDSPLTEEQEEWLVYEKEKYGWGATLLQIELSPDPDGDLNSVEDKGITYFTVGHQEDRIRKYSEPSVEELLISDRKPRREILTIHEMENGCIGATFGHGEPKKKIFRIFAGRGYENWSPYTIEKRGCGGSETMAAEVARQFQERDYQSFVYGGIDGVYDGVNYRNTQRYPNNYADIFISSRVPQIFDNPPPSENSFLWFHDVHRWDMLTPDRASEVTYINALTKWHAWYLKQCYPFLKDCEVIDLGHPAEFVEDDCPHETWYPDGELHNKPKITVIGNGIPTHLFEKNDQRRRDHRFIWASSPDRGLLDLLRNWKRIRKEFKDAQLHIFYGWEYFDNTLFIPYQRELKEQIVKLLNQNGVKWRGRVGREQLAKEFMMSHVWYYPLHYTDIVNKDGGGFRETYCITAMEAQAAGCLCVTRASGGLGETVADRGVLIPRDTDKELDYLFNLLYDLDRQVELREKGIEWAMKQSWSSIADKILSVCNGNKPT